MLNVRLQPSMLKILVGEKEQVFVIHEGVLTTRSKFFKNAMQKGWKEAEDKIVKLPEDDPTAFELYEQLVYAGHAENGAQADDCCDPVTLQFGTESYVLCKLYVFAEKLQDSKAKNKIMDTLVDRIEQDVTISYFPNPRAIKVVYDGTPSGSLARRLMVDLYVGRDLTRFFDTPDWHPEFMADLIKEFYKSAHLRDTDLANKRKYHDLE
ncbi:hypothetical protein BU26DRAFT_439443 [Trematosphaeria pertusa]|uniref:BTB domain-containing protein n=1 Tax=Trematosphaeria pertusa TaxID=390896 RepID=A0A6A6HWD6_9PLEO|nr:uncharacterized protein BU26DRAFT_439443 [Trematosphaeria pertusa]KAF2242042.1 hypothetical protein BU26DRAFT_439443 [Trematosphaeria pertusa]